MTYDEWRAQAENDRASFLAGRLSLEELRLLYRHRYRTSTLEAASLFGAHGAVDTALRFVAKAEAAKLPGWFDKREYRNGRTGRTEETSETTETTTGPSG